MRIFKLISYSLLLTWRTLYTMCTAYIWLRRKPYPASIYFNLGLLMPVFLDYADMIGNSGKKGFRHSVHVSVAMLIEDILIDEEKIDPKVLISLLSHPEASTTATSLQEMLQQILISIYKETSDREKTLLIKLNDAQLQLNVSSGFEEFLGYVVQKGLWFPALAFVFHPQMSDVEIETLTLLGFWIKCVDDAVDIVEDKQSRTITVYTHPESDLDPDNHLESLRNEVFTRIRELPHLPENIERFLYRISVSVYTFKRYNELQASLPNWYNNLTKKHVFFQVTHLLWASVISVPMLLRF